MFLRKLTPPFFCQNRKSTGRHILSSSRCRSQCVLKGHKADNTAALFLSPVRPSFVLPLTKAQMLSTDSGSVSDSCSNWSIHLWLVWASASNRLVSCRHSSHSFQCLSKMSSRNGKDVLEKKKKHNGRVSHSHTGKICLRKPSPQSCQDVDPFIPVKLLTQCSEKTYCQKSDGSGVSFHHAWGTRNRIYLASQNDPGHRNLETHKPIRMIWDTCLGIFCCSTSGGHWKNGPLKFCHSSCSSYNTFMAKSAQSLSWQPISLNEFAHLSKCW